MGTLPTTRLGKIEFYENHIQAWGANAAAIGLAPADIVALSALVSNARNSYNSAEQARAASRSATIVYHDQTSNLTDFGAGLLRSIRNFAESNDDPNVYALAQIPAPSPPGPVPPPGQPFELRVGLFQTGALELKWKANNPAGSSGTVYEVQRRVGNSAFEYIGAAGTRTFLDESLPAGSTGVVYQITGIRSTQRGQAAQFLVNFGVQGTTVTALTTQEVRLAA